MVHIAVDYRGRDWNLTKYTPKKVMNHNEINMRCREEMLQLVNETDHNEEGKLKTPNEKTTRRKTNGRKQRSNIYKLEHDMSGQYTKRENVITLS